MEVKRRLNIPFKRSGRDFEKMRRALSEIELKSDLISTASDQRYHTLEEGYKQMLEQYEPVIERLRRQGFTPESFSA